MTFATRRAVLAGLSSAAVFGPSAVRAQISSSVAPTVGLLRPSAPENPVDNALVEAFLAGLMEGGYERGKHVHVELRYAHGRLDRLSALARELAALPVVAMVTSNPYSTRAAREVTRSVPIIVALDYETDPVANGWITTLSRPGGNVTGLFLDQPEMSAKVLQMLKQCVPGLSRVAVLWDEAIARPQFEATVAAARSSGLVPSSLRVRGRDDLREAFEAATRERANGLVVLTSPRFTEARTRAAIVEMALKHRLPGITLFTTFPAFGFLMAYGPDQHDAFRRAASQYVVRILKGTRAGDLPVQRPDKFRFVVNAKTAAMLGLTIPQSVVLQADEMLQ